jgi:uncharacterized membrane protein
MNQRKSNFQDVFSQLAKENFLDGDWEQQTRDLLAREHNEQPWYVRVMVGFSAWLASWLLIGFMVGAAVIESEQATLMMGVVLVVGAVIARGISDNDFMSQMSLAVSLAGEGLIVYAVARISDSFEVTVLSFIVLELVLVAFYIDLVHRFLSSASIIVVLVGLLFKWEAQSFIHILVIPSAIAFVALASSEEKYLARGWAQLMTPVKWGVLFGQLAVLMLSTIYVLPELSMEIDYFPSPWISSAGLGLVFLYLVFRVIQTDSFKLTHTAIAIIFSTCALVILGASMAPGLIMALIILLLGFSRADRVLIGVAIGFFIVFLTAFFSGIEVTLLMKSLILVMTGIILLAGRFMLKFYLAAQDKVGANA